MIFVLDVTVDEWINKHPSLDIKSISCSACKATLTTTRPFITKGYIGLATPVCSCGSKLSRAEVAIPRTATEKKEWSEIVSYL